ncbi:MAG: hypothetical protein OWU33_16475 [Firmicutes bacterium]|nr:hypothetical protein [Bacillota bacterium]
MDKVNTLDPKIRATVSAPAILNLACFVHYAAGLISANGYHSGENYHWPYQETHFRQSGKSITFLEAAFQWSSWWDDLVDAHAQAAMNGHDVEEDTDHKLPPSLDPYPALRQAVAEIWPTFWGWWLYPYIGGKMALESAIQNRLPSLYAQITKIAPGHWQWYLIFDDQISPILHYKAPTGWGILSPHYFWQLDWITPKIFK